mgnify:CR=1 FL=1
MATNRPIVAHLLVQWNGQSFQGPDHNVVRNCAQVDELDRLNRILWIPTAMIKDEYMKRTQNNAYLIVVVDAFTKVVFLKLSPILKPHTQ